MAQRKLHIPAPDEETEVEGDISIVTLAALFCLLLAFGIGYFFSQVQPTLSEGSDESAEPVAEELDPAQKLLKQQRKLASTFDEKSTEELREHDWTEEEEVAVLRFGPRRATEVLCTRHSEAITAGKLDPIRQIELLKALERRVEFAPWTCMMRKFLAEELPEEGPLDREISSFWEELQEWKGNPRIPMSFLADFRESRDRPAVPEFYEWVRLCAMNYDYQATTECRRLLHQLAPAQGEDILAMIDLHLREVDGRISRDEAKLVISALGRLARNGQPPNWKIEETEALPDYDVDLRNATVLYLCRFVHSPETDLSMEAAEQLRRTADTAGRAYDKHLLGRWLETCRIAFDGGEISEEVREIPIIASWTGDPDTPPDYSLETPQRLGICETPAGKPIWWCGARQFAGRLDELEPALAHYFIETRHMEWPAPGESLLGDP